MSEIQVGQINSTDGSTAITTGADGYVSFAKTQIGGRRNLIINGAMQVAQRGTSATVSNGYNALDRVYTYKVHDGAVTESQSTDTPSSEFYYSLKHEVDTADTSIGAAQYHSLNWRIEGYDASRLGFGTSGAKSCVLSFWVKSSVTGDYGVALRNNDNNRFNMRTMTINTADTWEQKTITFTGDTAGTWLKTNGLGLGIQISMAMGTDFQGTSADTWVTNVDVSPPTQVNWLNTVGNTFYITGVQLEVGTVASPFEHISYGEQLALCQRYYEVGTSNFSNPMFSGYVVNTNTYYANAVFKVTKRANPDVTLTSTFGSAFANTSGTPQSISPESFYEGRPATGTGTGFFSSIFIAQAEL